MRIIFLFAFLGLVLASCSSRTFQPHETGYLFEEKKPFQPIKKSATIIVDAGHGGKDLGASNKKNAYEEKELTLSTAQFIKNYLSKLGYKVVLTRSQDTYVPLSTRAEIANSLGADLFVSIHYNFCSNEEVEGIEVYYYKDEKTPKSERVVLSKELGQQVLTRVIARTKAESRGVKAGNFAVIRETKMPAILIEGGFLSNPSEREKLLDTKYQRLIAWGVAKGIEQYLNSR